MNERRPTTAAERALAALAELFAAPASGEAEARSELALQAGEEREAEPAGARRAARPEGATFVSLERRRQEEWLFGRRRRRRSGWRVD
ncbi:MAG: hypothetical protein M5U26_16845 [Planctomycetota bacterium]|nr:hypothetical protein [Planctomycetota bacterium]